MAQKTEGIQQLLLAERKATEKVVEARKRKAARLKTAKKEADADILAYKKDKENEYKAQEAMAAGNYGKSESVVAESTTKRIAELGQLMKANAANARNLIQGPLFNVEMKLHENLRLA